MVNPRLIKVRALRQQLEQNEKKSIKPKENNGDECCREWHSTVYNDCYWLLILARIARLHPMSFNRKLPDPLSFSWTSRACLIAYIQTCYDFMLDVLGTTITLTMSISTIDIIGTFARGFVDIVLGHVIVVAGMRNTPKVSTKSKVLLL